MIVAVLFLDCGHLDLLVYFLEEVLSFWGGSVSPLAKTTLPMSWAAALDVHPAPVHPQSLHVTPLKS